MTLFSSREGDRGQSIMIRPLTLLQSVIVGIGVIVAPIIAADSIPPDKADKTKIYYGTPDSFEEPAEVRFEQVLKATPEYKKIKADNLERGSGRCVILLSQGCERVHRAISELGEDSDFDLIADKGYLEDLDPPIAAEDVTKEVIEIMEDGLEEN